MGQQQTKEAGSAGASASHSSHARSSSRAMTPSTSANLVASLSAASLGPPSPPPLPAHLGDSVKVDQGGLTPHGVYTSPKDYDQHFVRQSILDRRLAPFCQGSDDEEGYADKKFNSECPICFLYYPSPLNFSRCCHQPICSECFVQMKRADPTSTNPPSSQPRSCPFCVEPEFGVTYAPPEALQRGRRSSGSGSGSGSDSPNDATDAANFAEMAIGTGGVGVQGAGKKKILPADDPNVITVDQVRPDWHIKLAQAEAAVARRANRRVIMRQVGDRLIPIGISSSRMGADLAAAAESGRINLNGPGSSIILNEGQNWPASTAGVTTSRRRSSRPSRGAGEGLPEFARLMRMGAGEDIEEAMVMEAMRLSLLEHEEQQRKQAEEEKKKKAEAATAAASGTSRASTSNDLASSSTPVAAAQSVLEGTEASQRSTAPASSYSAPILPPPATSVDPASLGLSQTTMDELRELIDGSLSPPASNAASSSSPSPTGGAGGESSRRLRSSIPAPAPVPVPEPVARMGPVLAENHSISTQHNYPSPPPETDSNVGKHQGATTYSTTTASYDPNSSAPGSPSNSGFPAAAGVARSRIVNPNNPFRKSMGEHPS